MLGLELSFTTSSESERIQEVVDLLHSRYRTLEERAGHISKERLLIYLALSLADDYLRDQERLVQLENTLQQLLSKIEDPEK